MAPRSSSIRDGRFFRVLCRCLLASAILSLRSLPLLAIDQPGADSPADRSFNRIRDRLSRLSGDGFGASRGGRQVEAAFSALPDQFETWSGYHRIPTNAGGAVFVPVPPNAEHTRVRDENRWRAGMLRMRLMQQADRYQRLLDFNECFAGENMADPQLRSELEAARREFDVANQANRFDLWWRMLRTDPQEYRAGVPYGRRVLALYLSYRRSRWPQQVVPYANKRVRAFVSAPQARLMSRPDGRSDKVWVAEAWVAPSGGDPLVHIEYMESDHYNLALSLPMVLQHVAGIVFEEP